MAIRHIVKIQQFRAQSITVLGLTLLALGGPAAESVRATIGVSLGSHSSKAMAYEPLNIEHGAIATPEEIVAELNRVRQTPAAYAEWLETLRPYYDRAAFRVPGEVGVRTVEGVYALDHAIATLSQQQPLPPISLELGLVESTQGHLADLLHNDRFTLIGLDGSTPMTRADQYGTLAPGGKLTEVLSQGFKRAEVIVASLIIDDGSFNRSTRALVLNPDIATLGAGCGIGPNDMPLCVLDYATAYSSELPTTTEVDSPSTLPADTEPISTPPVETNTSSSQTSSPVLISSTDISAARPIASANFAASTATSTTASPQMPPSNSSSLEAVAISAAWSGELSTSQLETLAEELISETNLLRTNPSAYAEKLIQQRPYYSGNLVQVPDQPAVEVVEGVAALDEAIAALQNTPSLPTLDASEGMSHAAADHARDLGTADATGHYGSDNSDPFVRMNRYGKWDQPGHIAGENISYGPVTFAEWHIMQLLVDDNVPDRGHRQALLNPDYRDMGAACHAHPTYRIVCDMTYASNYKDR
ncbi:MAG: CAP domain-containing protein [Cyanobacteria bacterium P01_F01_bin.150]